MDRRQKNRLRHPALPKPVLCSDPLLMDCPSMSRDEQCDGQQRLGRQLIGSMGGVPHASVRQDGLGLSQMACLCQALLPSRRANGLRGSCRTAAQRLWMQRPGRQRCDQRLRPPWPPGGPASLALLAVLALALGLAIGQMRGGRRAPGSSQADAAAPAAAGSPAAAGALPVAGAGPLQAGDLALVINAADPLSEAIGSHYQRVRRIPAAQVIRVRFPPGRSALTVAEFQRLHRQVRRQTPAHVQAYALAWAAPWRVGCVSITSAFAFGRLRSSCHNTCQATPANPWYARGEIHRPWPELGFRPTMLLAASDATAGRALIDRGVAADGTAPAGSAYLHTSSDRLRNGRAAFYAATGGLLARQLHIRLLRGDGLQGSRDVIALFTGVTHMPQLESLGFRPGAVADHLTSYGGVLTGPSGTSRDGGNGQMSALRWLEAGATGSYGTVVEPCNLTSKFPHPGLLLTYYRRGDTLLESYWRSVATPEQGVFIGEPLARPWPARG